jgi:hypothetical protein
MLLERCLLERMRLEMTGLKMRFQEIWMNVNLLQLVAIAGLIVFPVSLNAQTPPGNLKPTAEQPTSDLQKDLSKDLSDPIAQVLAAKLMQNSADGKFYAERVLSRAEIATILVKAFSLEQSRSQGISQQFDDVPASHWANKAIKTVVGAGVMTGYQKNRFFPNQRVTRGEGFAIFANAYGIFQFPEDMVASVLAAYSDSKELPTWGRKAWATALSENFVNLDQNKRINSLKPMTRGDMAYALSQFLEKEKGRSGSLPKS